MSMRSVRVDWPGVSDPLMPEDALRPTVVAQDWRDGRGWVAYCTSGADWCAMASLEVPAHRFWTANPGLLERLTQQIAAEHLSGL